MHPNAERQIVQYGLPAIQPDSNVLEVGPDTEDIVKGHIVRAGHRYSSCDLYHPLSDGHAQYDAVVCSNVIEHVERPWYFVPWLASLLKPNGVLILGCPNSWPYHQSVTDDYFRVWPAGMCALLRDAGMVVDVAVQETGQGSTDTLAVGRRRT